MQKIDDFRISEAVMFMAGFCVLAHSLFTEIFLHERDSGEARDTVDANTLGL